MESLISLICPRDVNGIIQWDFTEWVYLSPLIRSIRVDTMPIMKLLIDWVKVVIRIY